jgi:hypothetical protein
VLTTMDPASSSENPGLMCTAHGSPLASFTASGVVPELDLCVDPRLCARHQQAPLLCCMWLCCCNLKVPIVEVLRAESITESQSAGPVV